MRKTYRGKLPDADKRGYVRPEIGGHRFTIGNVRIDSQGEMKRRRDAVADLFGLQCRQTGEERWVEPFLGFAKKLASGQPLKLSVSDYVRQFYPDFARFDRIEAMENATQTNQVRTAAMSHVLAIAFLLLPAMVGMTNMATAYGDDRPFRITTKRDDDKAEVKVVKDKATVSVHSPFGISQAVIERSGSKWPTTVMVRLQLKGLENLKVTNGKDTLEAAVSSQDSKVRLWKNGKEDSQLDSKRPYWMEIRMIGKDGKPVNTLPLKEGYFEMRLPKALFADNPKSITLNWIDFYR